AGLAAVQLQRVNLFGVDLQSGVFQQRQDVGQRNVTACPEDLEVQFARLAPGIMERETHVFARGGHRGEDADILGRAAGGLVLDVSGSKRAAPTAREVRAVFFAKPADQR